MNQITNTNNDNNNKNSLRTTAHFNALEVKTKKTGFPGIGNYIVKKITDKCQINPIVVTKVPKTLFITFPVQLCKSCKSCLEVH